MALRWWADDGPSLNADLAALRFFSGSGPVLLRNPTFFVIFQCGFRTPCAPPPPLDPPMRSLFDNAIRTNQSRTGSDYKRALFIAMSQLAKSVSGRSICKTRLICIYIVNKTNCSGYSRKMVKYIFLSQFLNSDID